MVALGYVLGVLICTYMLRFLPKHSKDGSFIAVVLVWPITLATVLAMGLLILPVGFLFWLGDIEE